MIGRWHGLHQEMTETTVETEANNRFIEKQRQGHRDKIAMILQAQRTLIRELRRERAALKRLEPSE